MARIKKPIFAVFARYGHTTKHEYPFHIVGKVDARYVSVGMTRDQAEALYMKFKELFENEDETHTVQH